MKYKNHRKVDEMHIIVGVQVCFEEGWICLVPFDEYCGAYVDEIHWHHLSLN